MKWIFSKYFCKAKATPSKRHFKRMLLVSLKLTRWKKWMNEWIMVSLFKTENIPLGPLFCWCAFFSAELYTFFSISFIYFRWKCFSSAKLFSRRHFFVFRCSFIYERSFIHEEKSIFSAISESKMRKPIEKNSVCVCVVFTSRMLYLAGFQEIRQTRRSRIKLCMSRLMEITFLIPSPKHFWHSEWSVKSMKSKLNRWSHIIFSLEKLKNTWSAKVQRMYYSVLLRDHQTPHVTMERKLLTEKKQFGKEWAKTHKQKRTKQKLYHSLHWKKSLVWIKDAGEFHPMLIVNDFSPLKLDHAKVL